MTQVFPPEIHPTAVMVRELAEHLVGLGWRVTVAAGFPHHPYGRLYPGYRKRVWVRDRIGDVDVVRAWHLTSPDRRIPIRAASFVSQAAAAGLAGIVTDRVDLVLVYGPPLIGPTIGWLVAQRHRARLVNVIYDIYPDIAVETGQVSNHLLIRAASLAERLQYRAADRTIVLSEGFKRTLCSKGVSEANVAVVPAWLDLDEIRPMDRNNAWRQEQSIPLDKTVVLYAGTIGVVSGAAVVADVAARIRERADIMFLFVGAGAALQAVQKRVRSLGLANVRFLPFQPRERLAEVQATGDIGLVTLAPGRGRTSVPSKVLGYMAAGRPVLAAVDADSDTAEQIRQANAGVVCEPGDLDSIASGLRRLADAPAERDRLGGAGRDFLVERFSKASVLDRYARVLEGVISQ
jgi:colanic acid biosynthesis glycosyl transferase WcaI